MTTLSDGAGSDALALGLDRVVVAETRLSQVDGERGRLVLRGHDVEGLAAEVGYESVFGLLFDGALPSASRVAGIRDALGAARRDAFGLLPVLANALRGRDGMAALRAALAQLPAGEDPRSDRFRLAGAAAVFAAAWARQMTNEPAVAPDPSLGHAADFLHMLSGQIPDEARRRALDTYLVTVAEHGMNASTFTARVVASTHADPVSIVVSALGALKGPLHGGAPGPVLDMLDEIGAPERANAWLEQELAAKHRIMGLGHRIYRVRDPRAAVLERALETLARDGSRSRYLALARAVERAAVELLARRYPDRRLDTNVEFYTAILLDALGLPRELFTLTFAVARVGGWLAHAEEQRQGGRLMRPRQRYVGPMPEASEAARLRASG